MANSKSLLRIVALDSELFTTFVHWLSAEASAKFAWLSGLDVFHIYYLFTYKNTKNPPLNQIFMALILV